MAAKLLHWGPILTALPFAKTTKTFHAGKHSDVFARVGCGNAQGSPVVFKSTLIVAGA
jgi:hypothetical protein